MEARHGHHRGYANDADGTRLGYVDLVHRRGHARSRGAGRACHLPAGRLGGHPTRPQRGAGGATLPRAQARRRPNIVRARMARPVRQPSRRRSSRQGHGRVGDREEHQQGGAVAGRALNVHTPERAWRKGAEGEERVGPLLDSLAKHGWKTLHSIPVGKNGDIDHLAIGPGGVVLVQHQVQPRGEVLGESGGCVCERRQDRLHREQIRIPGRARRSSDSRRRERAPPFVTPWVVLVNGNLLPARGEDRRATEGRDGLDELEPQDQRAADGPVLSPEQVHAIYEIARRSTTWA